MIDLTLLGSTYGKDFSSRFFNAIIFPFQTDRANPLITDSRSPPINLSYITCQGIPPLSHLTINSGLYLLMFRSNCCRVRRKSSKLDIMNWVILLVSNLLGLRNHFLCTRWWSSLSDLCNYLPTAHYINFWISNRHSRYPTIYSFNFENLILLDSFGLIWFF